MHVLMDVTYLNGRDDKHPDLVTFKNARAHVTLKMLHRQEFQKANETEQEVYILRLANNFITHMINLTDKEAKTLDKCAKDVGLQVSQVEAIAPRQDWSAFFRTFMWKVMCKEQPYKFEVDRVTL
ncbi:unnamed protein product, partial [Sphacelaria rigidula]